jgi:hypothetical protein
MAMTPFLLRGKVPLSRVVVFIGGTDNQQGTCGGIAKISPTMRQVRFKDQTVSWFQ